MAYDIEDDPQIREIAERLQGKTDYETCKNIWQYLLDHIKYRADVGKQEIKSPARLINDRSGDCKSYSLFTAVILRYLNIPHVFRFVSYDKRKEATHVYVMAQLPSHSGEGLGGEVIIDAVATIQAGQTFNKELKYTYHCDMANTGTRIAYLAGLPGAGRRNSNSDKSIGNPGDDSSRYQVWIGDDKEHLITPGKNFLYSRFDLILEYLNVATTTKELAGYFNQLDVTAALLYAYNYVTGDTEKFKRISFIICGMIADGVFSNPETDEDVRADRLDILLDQIETYYDGSYLPAKYDKETWQMLTDEVFPHNETVSTVSGIGAFWPWEVIADKIKSSGMYFLYNYIPDNELQNYPAIVTKKKLAQTQVRQWMWIDVFHTKTTQENLIRAGILARTGKTPEQFIKDYKAGNVRIGEPITLATIAAVISIIIGLITIIRAIWPPKNSPTNKDIINGGADVNNELFSVKKNYGNNGNNGNQQSSLSSLALPIALGASLLIGLLSKKK